MQQAADQVELVAGHRPDVEATDHAINSRQRESPRRTHGRLERGEVTDALQPLHAHVGEELLQTITPLRREQRVVGRPQHGRRSRHPVVRSRRFLGQAGRDRPRAGPIPRDRGQERSGRAVVAHEPLEVLRRQRELGTGPVRPEVREVGAHRVGAAVDQLLGQPEAMEGLVPVLALGIGLEHAPADPGHRRGEDERPHPPRRIARDPLGDAAADVVARDDRRGDPELVEQADHAARLRGGRVQLRCVALRPVGLPEPAQVRDDHLQLDRRAAGAPPPVGAVARPAVQEHDRGPGTLALIGERDAIDRGRAHHAGHPSAASQGAA